MRLCGLSTRRGLHSGTTHSSYLPNLAALILALRHCTVLSVLNPCLFLCKRLLLKSSLRVSPAFCWDMTDWERAITWFPRAFFFQKQSTVDLDTSRRQADRASRHPLTKPVLHPSIGPTNPPPENCHTLASSEKKERAAGRNRVRRKAVQSKDAVRSLSRGLPPCLAVYSLSSINRANPKSAILQMSPFPTRMFADRRSLWM